MTPTDPHEAHHGAADPRYDDGVPHHHGADDPLHNPDVAHEHSDVHVRSILTSAGIIGGVTGAVLILMWLLFGWFERDALARDPEISPVAAPPVQMPASTAASPAFGPAAPDGVQLLTNEPMALEQHRATVRDQLTTGGWVDQNAGIARIPIDVAKKLIAERGLPVREYDVVAPQVGTAFPATGESSGGRAITGAPAPGAAAAEQPAADAPPAEEPATGEPAAAPQPEPR